MCFCRCPSGFGAGPSDLSYGGDVEILRCRGLEIRRGVGVGVEAKFPVPRLQAAGVEVQMLAEPPAVRG
jgi:hypothetical protein